VIQFRMKQKKKKVMAPGVEKEGVTDGV